MRLDDLKENDVVVFKDGSCGKVTSCSVNRDINIISIVFIEKVSGIYGSNKRFCWTYRLDGSLWNALDCNNDIVKVIHA